MNVPVYDFEKLPGDVFSENILNVNPTRTMRKGIYTEPSFCLCWLNFRSTLWIFGMKTVGISDFLNFPYFADVYDSWILRDVFWWGAPRFGVIESSTCWRFQNFKHCRFRWVAIKLVLLAPVKQVVSGRDIGLMIILLTGIANWIILLWIFFIFAQCVG